MATTLDRGAHHARALSQSGAAVSQKTWFRVLGRTGLAARAVVYVVFSVLAFMVAFGGNAPAQASGDGALAAIAQQPGGSFLLVVLAAGLLAYAGWRFTQAVTGAEPATSDRGSAWKRIGWFAIGCVYVGLFAKAIGILGGSEKGSSGASSHPQPYARTVIGWPGGPGWVGLAAAAAIIGAIAFACWGVTHDYRKDLEEGRTPTPFARLVRPVGACGNLARAVIVALIGSYLMIAATDDRPSRVKSVDQVLQRVAHQPAGPWWLAIIAAGLLAFAALSGFEAVYRQI